MTRPISVLKLREQFKDIFWICFESLTDFWLNRLSNLAIGEMMDSNHRNFCKHLSFSLCILKNFYKFWRNSLVSFCIVWFQVKLFTVKTTSSSFISRNLLAQSSCDLLSTVCMPWPLNFIVAGDRFELPTSWLWAKRDATSPPRSIIGFSEKPIKSIRKMDSLFVIFVYNDGVSTPRPSALNADALHWANYLL